jgi:hypothetical protein
VGNNPVSNQEKIYSFLSCSLGSLARDKLQDATAIQRRRFVAAPRHVGKDYWQVRATPQKSLLRLSFFEKSWNKKTSAWLYMDECNSS